MNEEVHHSRKTDLGVIVFLSFGFDVAEATRVSKHSISSGAVGGSKNKRSIPDG